MLCQSSSRRCHLIARHCAGSPSGTPKIKPCLTVKQPSATHRKPSKSQRKIVSRTSSGERTYQSNQQYSVIALTDTTGTISERYAYDAYGKLSVFAGGGSALSASAYGNRYTYTGREFDGGLGLYHYRARMYDPVAGQFCSRDPIGFFGSRWNLYSYVTSNPLRYRDPQGLWDWDGDWIELGFGGLLGLQGDEVQAAAGQAIIDNPISNIGIGAATGAISGAATGAVGGAVVGGPVGVLAGAGGGLVVGAAAGGTEGAVTDGDPIDAAQNGAIAGAIAGGTAGVVKGRPVRCNPRPSASPQSPTV